MPADRNAPGRRMQDRAAHVATQILLIIRAALRDWLASTPHDGTLAPCPHKAAGSGDGEAGFHVGAGAHVRAEIEALLREEFFDIQQATLREIRPQDG
jgi:hypothetical protein